MSGKDKAIIIKPLEVGDLVNTRYYIGPMDYIERDAEVVHIFKKRNYNMVKVIYITKSKYKLVSCIKQLESGVYWP